MGLKKKKNIIIITSCVIVCFILYQLYFFLTITSEASSRAVPVFDHEESDKIVYIRSEHDQLITSEGVIKGVFFTQMPKYRPDTNNEFKCLKSEQKIQFDKVNDDFCDCEDGTDEPSTNACPDGIFYCDTQHHKASVEEVPSSKVNDGICDCCDGSDEWLNEKHQKLLSQSNSKHYRYYVTKCQNNCKL